MAEGSAVFELGEHAEKWAYKILHPKSTADKLGIKPGLVISAIATTTATLSPTFARSPEILRCQAAEGFRSHIRRRRESSRPCADREVSRLARQRGRVVDRLSEGQAGDQRAACARCRQAGWVVRCEGSELFRNAHRAEVRAAESKTRLVKSGLASLAPLYRLRKNSAFCLARVVRRFSAAFNAFILGIRAGFSPRGLPPRVHHPSWFCLGGLSRHSYPRVVSTSRRRAALPRRARR